MPTTGQVLCGGYPNYFLMMLTQFGLKLNGKNLSGLDYVQRGIRETKKCQSTIGPLKSDVHKGQTVPFMADLHQWQSERQFWLSVRRPLPPNAKHLLIGCADCQRAEHLYFIIPHLDRPSRPARCSVIAPDTRKTIDSGKTTLRTLPRTVEMRSGPKLQS